MNKTLKGYVLGLLTASLLTGSAALAKSLTQTIEVTYDNIKVYKDNVLCQLKDANGSVIEPFIYDGTTYMPVRGTANLADMEVTWDGANKSVYLWDNMVPSGTSFIEVCPPYETRGYEEFLQSKGKSFRMAGTNYSNGFILCGSAPSFYSECHALFNLNSKYSHIDFTIGHVDNTALSDVPVTFIVDGKIVEEITVKAEYIPQTVSIPVNYGLQLKIVTGGGSISPQIGFGNMTVK